MDKELEKHARKIDRFLKDNLPNLYMKVCDGTSEGKSYKLVSFRRTYIPADAPALKSLTIKAEGNRVRSVSKPEPGVIEDEPPRLAVTFVLGRSSAGDILHETFYEYGSIKLTDNKLMCSRLETICIPEQ